MPKVTLEKDKHLNEIIDAPCGECKRITKHKVLADIELAGREETHDIFIYGWDNEYQIVQCQGCETIMFRKTHTNSEDMEHYPGPDGWEGEYVTFEDYYPNPEKNRAGLSDDHLLPEKLQRIYNESLNVLNGNNPVLTGIGLRAIIETVCKDQSATGKNLYSQINSLVEQSVLTKDGAEILHKLRVLGNDAAHEVKPHDNVQLGLAFDVVEHLLQGVYILPVHAKRKFK
ncbi:DUF4145 domain-containing protein [Vreelandella lutescens]|uniref:DUF4145 domain-containing protein n=1 Tax=Vreelandella lutescens TaxID=1602943 RepID=A0ABQ1NIT1_9GAMM|nr:DUF4145 domain-containing protein [Halomonas lutescens]GGC76022.1 hypothetical protein GCM10011382_02290 [Halomonas lutescens]